MKQALALGVGLSVALHLSVVALWSVSAAGAFRVRGGDGDARTGALSVRLSAPEAPIVGISGEIPVVPSSGARQATRRDDHPDHVRFEEPAAASREAQTRGGAPTGFAPSLEGTEPSADDYLPRSKLSVAPRANSEIVLTYPPDGPAEGRFVGVLTLYIDESGRVRHVNVDEAELPASLAQVARHAFANANFLPGVVDGREVKSRIRIEVVFESRPRALPGDTRDTALTERRP